VLKAEMEERLKAELSMLMSVDETATESSTATVVGGDVAAAVPERAAMSSAQARREEVTENVVSAARETEPKAQPASMVNLTTAEAEQAAEHQLEAAGAVQETAAATRIQAVRRGQAARCTGASINLEAILLAASAASETEAEAEVGRWRCSKYHPLPRTTLSQRKLHWCRRRLSQW
jgi:hypothetical protein